MSDSEMSPASKTSDVHRLVMRLGDAVCVKLYGDDDWHKGIVINARKQWVDFLPCDNMHPFIADENNIVDWILGHDA